MCLRLLKRDLIIQPSYHTHQLLLLFLVKDQLLLLLLQLFHQQFISNLQCSQLFTSSTVSFIRNMLDMVKFPSMLGLHRGNNFTSSELNTLCMRLCFMLNRCNLIKHGTCFRSQLTPSCINRCMGLWHDLSLTVYGYNLFRVYTNIDLHRSLILIKNIHLQSPLVRVVNKSPMILTVNCSFITQGKFLRSSFGQCNRPWTSMRRSSCGRSWWRSGTTVSRWTLCTLFSVWLSDVKSSWWSRWHDLFRGSWYLQRWFFRWLFPNHINFLYSRHCYGNSGKNCSPTTNVGVLSNKYVDVYWFLCYAIGINKALQWITTNTHTI